MQRMLLCRSVSVPSSCSRCSIYGFMTFATRGPHKIGASCATRGKKSDPLISVLSQINNNLSTTHFVIDQFTSTIPHPRIHA
jgi:hypothetical protein